MNLLEEYKNSYNKFNFLNEEIEFIINKTKNIKKFNEYDSIYSYFDNSKKLNYLKLKIKNILELIKIYKNDNIYKLHSNEFAILNEHKEYLYDVLSFSLNNEIINDKITKENIYEIINIFDASFLENSDTNLIIDEVVYFMNYILNSETLNKYDYIVYDFLENTKNKLFNCEYNEIINIDNKNLILQDFNLQPKYLDTKILNIPELVNQNIISNSINANNKHKQGGSLIEKIDNEIKQLMLYLSNTLNCNITILIFFNSLKNVEYKNYNSIKKQLNISYPNVELLNETNIIKIKNDSIFLENSYKLYNLNNNINNIKKILILETYNNEFFNILSDSSLIILNFNKFEELINKLKGDVNIMSKRILCYNDLLYKNIKHNISSDLNIQEFYTFINQKIIESKEKKFHNLIEEIKISINFNDKFEDTKKKIKNELYKFFVTEFDINDNELIIFLKFKIKKTILDIKKDYLNDNKQIYTSISYILSKPDNIFDSMIETLSYEKYYNYLKEFK